LEILSGQARHERSRQLSYVVYALGIRIKSEHLTPRAKQMNEVSSIAAPCIEHAHAGADIAAQDLVEHVDINLAELFLHAQCHAATNMVLAVSSGQVHPIINAAIQKDAAPG
jgi:hypothetical protein